MASDAPALEWPAQRVRSVFFDFFGDRGHKIVPSASVVPHNDPSLLFANAGMNQFKPIFLGTVGKTDDFANLKRATDTQKCIRAGGKHNDLDDVGKDSYHHTFFEMLGNWSFGDYFKREAIEMAWQLLTRVYGLDATRLYVTYFEGDPAMGLEPDFEARELWKSIGVPEERIIPGNSKDNFWEMGNTGPCGPCSEIHYDKVGGGRDAAHLVNRDDPLVVEIWNLVFIQFNREPDQSLKLLPAKHIDTGLGYERLVSALQDKPSNYATDVFTPLFDRIRDVTGARQYTDRYGRDDVDGVDTAYRVVADHVRMLAFSVSDGAVPNNDGRGYVIRRVLRRGARYARKFFNAEIGSFFSKILPALVDQMAGQFPELAAKQADVAEILDEEEVAFARTLDRGETQFERYVAQVAKAGGRKLPGDMVWRLYDTYGFPEDLTRLMCEERGLDIDNAEVDAARQRAKEASKAVKHDAQTFAGLTVHHLAELEQLQVPRPDDDAKFAKGDVKSRVRLAFDGRKLVESTAGVPARAPLGIILDRTNFYAESGGQVADTGRIVIDDVAEFEVVDVQLYGSYVVHHGFLKYGALSAGDEVICEYDELRRQPIRSNHTGTHVLNHSLREVLGDDVHQKGSLVDHEKLRFDFSHKTGVKPDELARVEDLCNRGIRQNLKTYAKDVDLDLARQIAGVRAVFGETYPSPVRVVSIGVDVDALLADPANPEWRRYSVEFCGGTHVEQTGLIKDLVIVEESGIAKGIRRIVAHTGAAAHDAQRRAAAFDLRLADLEALALGLDKEQLLKEISAEFGALVVSVVTKDKLKARLDKVAREVIDELKRRQKAEHKAALDAVVGYFAANPEAAWYAGKLPVSTGSKVLSEVTNYFRVKDKTRSVYLFSDSAAEGSVVHAVYVGTDLSSKGVTAQEWASTVCGVIGGKSGGKEPILQGRGTKPEKLDEALDAATKWIEDKLKL